MILLKLFYWLLIFLKKIYLFKDTIWNMNIQNKEIVSDANTDLLFSLFQSIEDQRTTERKYRFNLNTRRK